MMLDENDLLMIAKLLDQQNQELHGEFGKLLGQQKQELRGEFGKLLDQQKQEQRGEFGKLLDQQKRELRGEFLTVIESEVTPKLRLLAEGQDAILEKMVPPSRVDALEADVSVLKDAVKYLSQRVQALEKAQ